MKTIGSIHPYQVVLKRIWPNVILNHFAELIGPCIRVVQKPTEERFLLLPVAPLLARFLRAGLLCEILKYISKYGRVIWNRLSFEKACK